MNLGMIKGTTTFVAGTAGTIVGETVEIAPIEEAHELTKTVNPFSEQVATLYDMSHDELNAVAARTFGIFVDEYECPNLADKIACGPEYNRVLEETGSEKRATAVIMKCIKARCNERGVQFSQPK